MTPIIRNVLLGARNVLLGAAATFALAIPGSAQTLEAMDAVHTQAAKANTPASHAAVAKQYRLQAEAFAAKAAEHEKNAQQITRASGAIVRKFPGMASSQLQGEKAKAVEARRAQREAMQLADRHIRLAVEAQAQPQTPVAAN